MTQRISLAHAPTEFLGSRFSAQAFRDEITACLAYQREVRIDFAGVSVGTSFLDELVGILIVHFGSSILERLIFENCNDEAQGLLRFVVATRLEEQKKVGARSRLSDRPAPTKESA